MLSLMLLAVLSPLLVLVILFIGLSEALCTLQDVSKDQELSFLSVLIIAHVVLPFACIPEAIHFIEWHALILSYSVFLYYKKYC